MSELAQKAASMLDMLPMHEQQLAYEMVKRIVIAWGPDFTKLPPQRPRLCATPNPKSNAGKPPLDEIDWDAD